MERADGTHRAESWQVTDAAPDLDSLRAALLAWETCYDTVRPHQALGHPTPAERLARLRSKDAQV